jgi:hypothetical protein
MQDMARRLEDELNTPPPLERICRGTLLSTTQYVTDVDEWGYCDPRSRISNNSSPSSGAK